MPLDVTDDVSVGMWVGDTRIMHAERMPRKTNLWTVLRTYPVPWSLFLAAALASVVLALR